MSCGRYGGGKVICVAVVVVLEVMLPVIVLCSSGHCVWTVRLPR